MNRVVMLAAFLSFAAVSSVLGQPSSNVNHMTIDQMIDALRPRAGTSEPPNLRGIRPPTLSTSPQAARRSNPGAPAVAPPPVQAQVNGSPSINLNVQFRTNSSELTAYAVRTLDELGHALSSDALAPYRFRIVGHTDAPGSADYNKRLSEQRAQTVVDYMVTKYAVARERLDAAGVGSEDPLVRTPKSEWRNRRVQIVNVGG